MTYNIDDFISVREAARQCGRNMETVRRWIWGGKLPAEKLGNQLFIKKKDLAVFCRETATLKYSVNPLENEIEDIINKQDGIPMIVNTIMEKEDFLAGALRLRKKLRARGYLGVDTAALVRKSREGWLRELRQSLR